MSWLDEDRRRSAEGLQEFRDRIAAFYRRLLIAATILFVGFVLFVVLRSGLGSGSQGEWFYFGLFVLLVLGWLASQFRSVRPPRTGDFDLPSIRAEKTDLGRGKLFRIQIGEAPTGAGTDDPGDGSTFTFSRSFQGRIPLPSSLAEHTPDEATLAAAEEDLAQGRDWDFVCDRINPAYAGWGSVQRSLYRRYVEALLEARRSGGNRAE